MKCSKIIKDSCCGQMLDVPRDALAIAVEKIELKNKALEKENKLLRDQKGGLYILLWSMIVVFYVWMFL